MRFLCKLEDKQSGYGTDVCMGCCIGTLKLYININSSLIQKGNKSHANRLIGRLGTIILKNKMYLTNNCNFFVVFKICTYCTVL